MKISQLFYSEDAKELERRLAECGFDDGVRARRLLEALAKTDEEKSALCDIGDELVADLADSADPMRALLNLSHLADTFADKSELWSKFAANPELRGRTCRLMAFSQSLADTLVRHPGLLNAAMANPRPKSRGQLRCEALALAENNDPAVAIEKLRAFRQRETLRIALLDLDSPTWRDLDSFNLVVREISDLAAVCIQAALRILAPEAPAFCVLGMGKLGSRELNYSSDIDLIFIHDGDNAAMTQLGTDLLKALGDSTSQGTLFRVDMRLRPDGKSGALVTPIGYALSYYESFAAPWEWQALIKTRAVAGDAKLGRRFRKFTRAITWARRADDSHLRDMLAMKKRMEGTPEGKDPQNVKQGPGAIRDAEWIVQQLQMMVGPGHPRCRIKATLRALHVLEEFDALTQEEERRVRQGYLFLRVLEHRLQLLDERAVRTLPKDPKERAALARRMGATSRGAAAARWLEEELAFHRTNIRAITERLFWGWSEADDSEELSPELSAETAQRLERIAAGTTANPLPAPLARQIRVALAPVIEHIEHAANPERAVLNLERLCEASGNRLSLLRSLGGAPQLARAVFSILGGSSRLSDVLARFPELLDLAAQRASLEQSRPWPQALTDCRDYCFAFRDKSAALRRWKQRELLRIGLRDLALNTPSPEITAEIATLAQACLTFACEEVARSRRPASENIAFSVLGMGKLGGGEMHYNSDADVIFVYDDYADRADLERREAGAREAEGWAKEFMHLLGERTEEGVCFEIDARLRPDGQNGALVKTVAGFIDYFERPTNGIAIWERQALTRARFIAGDPGTAARLRAAIQHVAFPEEWQEGWGEELRHIKTRVEKERATRGSFDVKLGPGCLSDIEFCAQWLALKNGARFPDLQTPNTLRQIEAARAAELLSRQEADALSEAYIFLRRAELRLQVTHEHTVKAVKRNSAEWASWARAVFPDEEDAEDHFAAEWESRTQAARTVMERVRDEL